MLTVFTLSSCVSVQEKVYESSFVVATPDGLHDSLLQRIDLTYRDLNLTKNELAVLKKYSKYGNVLRAAAYEWPAKSETLTFKDSIYGIGVDVFEIEALAQIMGVNIEITQTTFDDAIELVNRITDYSG